MKIWEQKNYLWRINVNGESKKATNKLGDGVKRRKFIYVIQTKESPGINFNNIWCCNQQWGDEGERA